MTKYAGKAPYPFTPGDNMTGQCSVSGCSAKINARGWCMKHYTRWKRHGDPLWEPPPTLSFEQRLARHVLITASCWLWTGATSRGGYGHASPAPGRFRQAHRWVYETLAGPIPDGMQLDHLCRVVNCVNPDHLEVVTPAENVARSSSARKRYCIKGHDLTIEANVLRKGNLRRCRPCLAEHAREHRRRAALEGAQARPSAEKTSPQVSQVPPGDSVAAETGIRP